MAGWSTFDTYTYLALLVTAAAVGYIIALVVVDPILEFIAWVEMTLAERKAK